MRTLIIGDIHGCWDELQDLLDRAGLADDDAIISVGDLVDRGPDSARVLDFFQTTPNARTIMGNHEYKHVRAARNETSLSNSLLIAREQIGEARYPDALQYMAALPTYLRLPEVDLVHAFFEPGVPLEDQRTNVIVGTGSSEEYLDNHYDEAWYMLYDGAKPLIVGHRNYMGDATPFVYPWRGTPKVYAIDTGCVYGGALTGLLLPEFELISVPARADHWAELQQRYGDDDE